jgi:hypothetical protein
MERKGASVEGSVPRQDMMCGGANTKSRPSTDTCSVGSARRGADEKAMGGAKRCPTSAVRTPANWRRVLKGHAAFAGVGSSPPFVIPQPPQNPTLCVMGI